MNKNKMKKIFVLLFLLIAPFYVITNPLKNTQVILDFDQFDSLCINDSIPRNLSKWDSYDYIGENEKLIITYTFIKNDSIVYNVTPLDDGYFNVNKSAIK